MKYFFLAILLLMPVFIALGNKYLFNSRMSHIKMAFINFLILYLLIVSVAIYLEISLDNALNKYDLNNDGRFSEDEINPEQTLALKRVTRDTGRTLAPITGFIYSLFYSIVFYFFLKIKNWLGPKKIESVEK